MISSLLEAIPLPAVFIGTDARILGANSAAVLLQPNADDRRAFVLVFRQPGINKAIEACLYSKEPQKTAYLHSDDGHEVHYDVTCSFVEMSGLSGVLACFRDVTEVEQAGEIRRDFVANVSHELKTPLTALLGFIETLQGPARNDPKAQGRFLDTMSAEANRMNRLVGDLLSLSRVEEYARMRPTEEVNLADVVSLVVRNLSEVAKSQETDVNLHGLDEKGAFMVQGDRDQLLQVFTNLIENALKYGGKGGKVSVSFERVPRDIRLRRPAVRVDVKDQGPGIDPLHIPRLTERFYRIDSHRSREIGGTGLGLAIVKHIVNRHRGRMKIDSALGQGSVFSVILPKS